MNVLSLFDGISGTQQALKELNIPIQNYLASEIDKYAIQITQKNFPDTKQLGDVKRIKFYEDWDDNNIWVFNEGSHQFIYHDNWGLPYIDLLSFGFPCQDLSIAKKDRKGLEGERSGLFYEALRILKSVKPKFFIAENVASMSKDVKEEITKELFGIEATTINSALLTAQTRKRHYWVGKLQQDGTYTKVDIPQPKDAGILLKDIIESGITYQDKSYAVTASYNGAIFWNTLQRKQRTMILEPIRLGHFNKGGQGDRIYSINGKSTCLSANGGGRGAKTGFYLAPTELNGENYNNIYLLQSGSLYKILENGDKGDLQADFGRHDLPDGYYIARKLTIKECERLQGFPDDYFYIGDKLIISKTQGYTTLGNSFTVPVIKHILQYLYENK